MVYTGAEKKTISTFFNRYSPGIKHEIQEFANSRHRLPGIAEFITIVNQYVRDPANNIAPSAAMLLTATRMQADVRFISKCFETAVSGIIVPVQPPPSAAAPPLVQPDGAILADGSPAAKNKVIEIVGLSPQDAVSSVNTGGMSASTLYVVGSTGVFYHHTIHSFGSVYGARDDDGIYKITYVYTKYDGYFYLVGFAKHNGKERVIGKRNPVDKYIVQKSLIPTLSEGATLHFR